MEDTPRTNTDNPIKLQISVALWEGSSNLILIDTGASANIFSDRSFFTSFDDSFNTNSVKVILADGTECDNIIAKGTVTLTLTTSTGAKMQVILQEAYLLPTLNHKGILSVKYGIKQGYEYHFGSKSSYVLIDKVKCPFLSKDHNDLFYINVNTARVKNTIA